MTDPIRRREDAACRTPEDDAKASTTETGGGPPSAATERPPRQACAIDIDWDHVETHAAEPMIGPPPAPPAPPPKPSTNNATRTAERDLSSGAYADAGYAPGGHAVYAGAAAIKGRDARSGVEIEAMSASVQVGAQHEAQITGIRLGVSGKNGSLSAEGATVNAHIGIHNPDGSTGMNTGAGAVLVSAEGTAALGANSVTLGVGAGLGAEFSAGARDKDSDGKPEACFRLGLKFLTVGACVELPFHAKL